MDFGTRLKEARSNIGLRQEDISEAIGVSRQTVSNWENNRSLPDLRSIVEISDVYQISLDDLLKGDRKVMDKLIKDSDVKKMGNRVNLLTILVLTVTTSSMLFLDNETSSGVGMSVLLGLSLFVRIGLVVLLFYTIIKYTKLSNMQQIQSGSTEQPKYNVKVLSIILIGIGIIGFLVGLIAGLI
ncbi:MAG: helix-turn-helix domain-containing protein [Erysipelothrix sp.]